MIAIVDYGAGNLSNVKNLFDFLGEDSVITSDPAVVKKADRVVLPGVGAFGYLMDNLKKKGLDKAIIEAIGSGKPFLGVCLGFQALFEESEESPGAKGLCVLRGKVVKLRHGKVPHIGWNNVKAVRKSDFEDGFAYFVHSYHPDPNDKDIILFETDYHRKFCSGVMKDNILAVQFHPERSGKWGIDFYRSWLKSKDQQ